MSILYSFWYLYNYCIICFITNWYLSFNLTKINFSVKYIGLLTSITVGQISPAGLTYLSCLRRCFVRHPGIIITWIELKIHKHNVHYYKYTFCIHLRYRKPQYWCFLYLTLQKKWNWPRWKIEIIIVCVGSPLVLLFVRDHG